MEVIDGATGEVRRTEIFVAVLGASSYTFAEATWTQSLPDWIAAHVAMLAFIGGAPRQIVSDNLRAGITRACFYEPLVNLANGSSRPSADLGATMRTFSFPVPARCGRRAATAFSLEAADGVRFVARSRLFIDAEFETLRAAGDFFNPRLPVGLGVMSGTGR